jgi:hypothetical protein
MVSMQIGFVSGEYLIGSMPFWWLELAILLGKAVLRAELHNSALSPVHLCRGSANTRQSPVLRKKATVISEMKKDTARLKRILRPF